MCMVITNSSGWWQLPKKAQKSLLKKCSSTTLESMWARHQPFPKEPLLYSLENGLIVVLGRRQSRSTKRRLKRKRRLCFHILSGSNSWWFIQEKFFVMWQIKKIWSIVTVGDELTLVVRRRSRGVGISCVAVSFWEPGHLYVSYKL